MSKRYHVMTGIMLFSTVLGLVLPISMKSDSHPQATDVSVRADDVNVSDVKAQTIKSESDKVDQGLAALEADSTVNLAKTETDTATALKTAFNTNIEKFKAKGLYEELVSEYNAGTIDDNTFLRA